MPRANYPQIPADSPQAEALEELQNAQRAIFERTGSLSSAAADSRFYNEVVSGKLLRRVEYSKSLLNNTNLDWENSVKEHNLGLVEKDIEDYRLQKAEAQDEIREEEERIQSLKALFEKQMAKSNDIISKAKEHVVHYDGQIKKLEKSQLDISEEIANITSVKFRADVEGENAVLATCTTLEAQQLVLMEGAGILSETFRQMTQKQLQVSVDLANILGFRFNPAFLAIKHDQEFIKRFGQIKSGALNLRFGTDRQERNTVLNQKLKFAHMMGFPMDQHDALLRFLSPVDGGGGSAGLQAAARVAGSRAIGAFTPEHVLEEKYSSLQKKKRVLQAQTEELEREADEVLRERKRRRSSGIFSPSRSPLREKLYNDTSSGIFSPSRSPLQEKLCNDTSSGIFSPSRSPLREKLCNDT